MNFVNSTFTYISWNVDPRIFPPLEQLRWYGLFWAVGMALGYYMMQRIYRKEGRPLQEIDTLALYVIIGVVLGARLGHVLFYEPGYYWQHPIEILPIRVYPKFEFIGFRGLASHGGVVGAVIALYFYQKKFGVNYLWLLDRMMLSGLLLGSCIRLGNLMNSEILGKESSMPWAFIFKRFDHVPRHPAQLYEAIAYLGIFFIVYRIWQKRKVHLRSGYLLGLGLVLIFIQRFLVEFLKMDQVPFEANLWLNVGQILSIPMIGIGLFFLLKPASLTQKDLTKPNHV